MKNLIFLTLNILILFSCKSTRQSTRLLPDGRPVSEIMVQKDPNYKELEIIKTEPLNQHVVKNGSYPYFSEKIDFDKYPFLKNLLTDTSFLQSKLPHTILPKNADRIITYGNNDGYSLEFYTGLKIFDRMGRVIKSIDIVALNPFEVATDGQGNFYIAGKKPDSDKLSLFLAKYDFNGNLSWSVPINTISSFSLYVSDNGKYIALCQYDNINLTTIYSSDGSIFSSTKPSLGPIQFLDEYRILASDRNSWGVYDLKNNFLILKRKYLKYGLYGFYPFTLDQNKKYFTTVAIKDDNTTLLSVYDAATLNMISEKDIPYSIDDTYGNPVSIEGDHIYLRVVNQLIDYKIK